MHRLLLPSTILAAIAFPSASAGGAAPADGLPSYELEVSVDAETRRVVGRARIEIVNQTAAPLEALYFWRYPERLAQRSPALNDYNFYWIYPRSFNPGALTVSGVTVDGKPAAAESEDHPQAGRRTLLRVPLALPLPPGGRAAVDISFSVKVPERYGAFGCYRGTCTLGGGFYPLLAAFAESGFDLGAPPAPARYRVSITVPRASDVFVNGAFLPLACAGSLSVNVGAAPAAALVVGRPRYRAYPVEHRGVHVVFYSAGAPPVPSAPDQVLPYMPSDRPGRTLGAVKQAIDMLSEMGAPMRAGESLRLIEGALRIELAQALPGFTLVSDQLFDIFPGQRFLKFHEFELVRAVYAEYVSRRIAERERPSDLGWAPEVAASYLVDLYTLRAYRTEEFARQILFWVSFIPAIDRILYAPQVPFATAYFNTVEDPDPLRDSLAQFNNQNPRGKLMYEKLRDLLGGPGLNRILRLQLEGAPLREAALAVRGGPLDWFFTQWLGPYPAVDYRFRDVRCTRRGPRHTRCTAWVEKRGEHPPIEPVEVFARDARGRELTQVWDGHGREHAYVFELTAPLKLIEINPRGRLLEQLPGDNNDLRFDDRRPPRTKFVYNNFGGLVNFQTGALDLSLDFTLSRVLDLKNAIRFFLYHNESTVIGLTTAYTRHFGRKITAARLGWNATTSLNIGRIDPSFGRALGGVSTPGTQIAASFGLGFDDRLFIWEPTRVLSLGFSAGYILTVLDSAKALSQATVSAGWESIVPLADGHGLALLATAAATFGDLRIARQMLAAGGPLGLRGYEADELLGRVRLLARAEYRHVLVHDLNVNLLYTLYVRGISGGAFVEAAAFSPCTGYGFDKKGLAYDVGYSLRFLGDWFGVSQTVLNIDVAVPLERRDRACFGGLTPASTRAPFGFYLSFGPPW